MPEPIPFGIIGAGWRAEFFLRVAAACSQQFRVTGVVTRDPQRAARMQQTFGVRTCASLKDLLDGETPAFVVTSVPPGANAGLLHELHRAGVPALSETPPASTLEELTALGELARQGARIQVAEQCPFQPAHAARIRFAAEGRLGPVHQAQVSVAHGYHGTALIRRLLGVGHDAAVTVSARSLPGRVVDPGGREGPTDEEQLVDDHQLLAVLDFGEQAGVLDFTHTQYFSPIRQPRILVRGSHGEMTADHATVLLDHRTPATLAFRRHEAGPNGNLDGYYLKGIQVGERWLYRNPLAPARLADDEIAVGACLLAMARYVEAGEGFYSLAEGCADRYLELLMNQARTRGEPVRSERHWWHDAEPAASTVAGTAGR